MPPPAEVRLPGEDAIDLIPLAREICRRYREEFPDEAERYGDAGIAWCEHDNRHILRWAAIGLELEEPGYLERQIRWLADVLEARDFPLDRLVRNLEIAAEVAAESGLSALKGPLAAVARLVPGDTSPPNKRPRR